MRGGDASIITAAALGIPDAFNAAAHFVDARIAAGQGEQIAIECGDERITYAGVLERVNRAGSALRRALDVREEERIALLLYDGPAFVYAFFGAIKIGAVPIPLNTLWKASDYEFVLRDSRARVLIVSEPLLSEIERIPRGALRDLRQVVVVGSGPAGEGRVAFADLLAGGDATLAPAETSRDAPAFWLYSSGSTGAPKGCVHLQHDMAVSAELYGKGVLGIRPTDRTFSVAKLFFAYGLGNALYFPFSVGATTILWPGAPTPSNIYRVVETHRPTLFFSVPTGYGMLLAHARERGAGAAEVPDFDLSSIRLAVSAGEALPPTLFERFRQRFGVTILDGIGSTEAAHMFISNRPDAVRPGSSGLLIRGYDARLLDEDGAEVGDGEIGNLWIAGDSVCAAYWNQHEKTKATMRGQWLRTGDKYTRDRDGFYWYAGRSDDMLKVGGLWVSPVEIENALLEHPAVLECAVVGSEDHDTLIKPEAFVVLREGTLASTQLAGELQQFVQARLAKYKRPRWVKFVPELPKTATGKIQRFKLRGRNPAIR